MNHEIGHIICERNYTEIGDIVVPSIHIIGWEGPPIAHINRDLARHWIELPELQIGQRYTIGPFLVECMEYNLAGYYVVRRLSCHSWLYWSFARAKRLWRVTRVRWRMMLAVWGFVPWPNEGQEW